MPFLNNNKFKELRIAASNGNEKAKMVLQALRQGSQNDVDRLVGDYYSIPQVETPSEIEHSQEQSIEDNVNEIEVNNNIDNNVNNTADNSYEEDLNSIPVVEDLTEVLDKETDGLFDENEIESIDFSKFLSNKRRDGVRSKKNSEYFSAFNPESRENYITKKKDAYKAKFGDSIHDIDRQYQDYDKSIDKYSQGINDLLDDNIDVNVDVMGDAYNEIMDNNGIMHSFGRHWDDVDTEHVIEDLKQLVNKYGKKNVLSALNVLKNDNSNFRDYKLGQINEEVERYNKVLDKVLK